MTRLLVLVLAVFAVGCEQRDTVSTSPFHQEECEYALLIAIDLSDSFKEYMAENGKAYDFVLHAVDQYFRARIGGNDQLIIAQLSGSKRPLLWQGTPHQLRREFPTREAFRDYLIAHADRKGSRINDGVAEAIHYVMHTRSVAQGTAKSAVLILSNMVDDQPNREKSDPRLMTALTTYARSGGAIGFYFCDQLRMDDLTQKMQQAGFRMCTLECDVNGHPALPDFE